MGAFAKEGAFSRHGTEGVKVSPEYLAEEASGAFGRHATEGASGGI